MKNLSFKNYTSGGKGIFLGGLPNLRKHSFKNYSSGKKGTIFLGWPSNLKKHSFQNYSFGKKRSIFLGWTPNQTWKKELYFWERPERAKIQLQKL